LQRENEVVHQRP